MQEINLTPILSERVRVFASENLVGITDNVLHISAPAFEMLGNPKRVSFMVSASPPAVYIKPDRSGYALITHKDGSITINSGTLMARVVEHTGRGYFFGQKYKDGVLFVKE